MALNYDRERMAISKCDFVKKWNMRETCHVLLQTFAWKHWQKVEMYFSLLNPLLSFFYDRSILQRLVKSYYSRKRFYKIFLDIQESYFDYKLRTSK